MAMRRAGSKALRTCVVLIAVGASALTAGAAPVAAVGPWTDTGRMVQNRFAQTATLLADGKVLVAGGTWSEDDKGGVECLTESETYDPGSAVWSRVGSMATGRTGHTATALGTGKVLVAGGSDCSAAVASAEVYNPVTRAWSATGTMTTARWGHTATLLGNGKTLVAGGGNTTGTVRLASAELYDPATGAWTRTGNMTTKRWEGATATLLGNGKVLVAGGCCDPASGADLASAELYDPATGTWTSTGSMTMPREQHTATLLPNGRVLVVGGKARRPDGTFTYRASAETYDPTTGRWSPAGAMSTTRVFHTISLLQSGKVLVTGGNDYAGGVSELSTAELYDPATGAWSSAGSMTHGRYQHTATLLRNGKVLATGGDGDTFNGAFPSELYSPASVPCTISGTAGSDVLTGTAGHDVICAAGGNDVVNASAGNDIIFGGTGEDTISYSSATAGVTVNLMNGAATGRGNDLLVGFEDIDGSPQADTLTGDPGRNSLAGKGGNDVLYGLGGGDILWGGDGADVLRGADGNDQLTGGIGTDTCDGGSGNDTATTCETKVNVP
jgi:Ca2+-binding RTX toxin-like protein